MVHSINVTHGLLRDILTLLADGNFTNLAESELSDSFPGGSTKEELVDHVIKELEYAATAIVYTTRL